MGTILLPVKVSVEFPLLAIMLLYLAVPWSGAQSVTVNRNTHYSDGLD